MRLTHCVVVVLATVAVSWSQEAPKTCRNIPQVDLVLLLDASTSIGPSTWKKEIQYVTDFIQSFSLGLDDVRFGAVMFNKYSNKLYDLKTYHNPLQAAKALKDIPYPDVQGTNTHLALNQVLSYQMFSEASGGRDNVEDVVVVLTDGRSGQPTLTQEEVDKLQAANITIITVGIGKVNTEELSRMATKSMKVFSTENNQLRDYIKKTYAKENCDPPPEVIPRTNYTMRTLSPLISTLTSIGPVDLAETVTLIHSPQSLLEIRYPNISGTNTHLGLSHIRTNNLFDAAAGGRDDARNLVIVMTDGLSNHPNQTASEAVLLKGSGVDMLSVGIGTVININELIAMASDLEYVLRSQSYALLDYIKRDLVTTTCESKMS
ncbi:Collagen alpha-5(VI) chain [Bulinus truncatus]|nr:Collagen alpha-5(VI) chain [Bulinus truncatus]